MYKRWREIEERKMRKMELRLRNENENEETAIGDIAISLVNMNQVSLMRQIMRHGRDAVSMMRERGQLRLRADEAWSVCRGWAVAVGVVMCAGMHDTIGRRLTEAIRSNTSTRASANFRRRAAGG